MMGNKHNSRRVHGTRHVYQTKRQKRRLLTKKHRASLLQEHADSVQQTDSPTATSSSPTPQTASEPSLFTSSGPIKIQQLWNPSAATLPDCTEHSHSRTCRDELAPDHSPQRGHAPMLPGSLSRDELAPDHSPQRGHAPMLPGSLSRDELAPDHSPQRGHAPMLPGSLSRDELAPDPSPQRGHAPMLPGSLSRDELAPDHSPQRGHAPMLPGSPSRDELAPDHSPQRGHAPMLPSACLPGVGLATDHVPQTGYTTSLSSSTSDPCIQTGCTPTPRGFDSGLKAYAPTLTSAVPNIWSGCPHTPANSDPHPTHLRAFTSGSNPDPCIQQIEPPTSSDPDRFLRAHVPTVAGSDTAETTGECTVLVGTPNAKPQHPLELDTCRIVNLQQLVRYTNDLTQHAAQCAMSCGATCNSVPPIVLEGEVQRDGLASVLQARCSNCDYTIHLHTSHKVTGTRGQARWACNLAAVWGQMVTGGGHSTLAETLSTLGVPVMTKKTFVSTERQIGEWWAKELEESMKAAAKEERTLAIERGDFHQGVPCITVIVDGGWCKRSHKHSYNAASGVAVIIGHETGKLLHLGVRNKFCMGCTLEAKQQKEDTSRKCHVCYRNWHESSSAMETDIILEGFKAAESKYGLRYTRVTGDGDSSVYPTLIQNVPGWGYAIQKLECANHACKCYR